MHGKSLYRCMTKATNKGVYHPHVLTSLRTCVKSQQKVETFLLTLLYEEERMKKISLRVFTVTLALAAFCFAGCSKNEGAAQQTGQPAQAAVRYKDGVYKAVSGIKDDWGGYAEVTITVKDGKIVDCEFLSYEKDGTLKDEDYGKTDGVIKNAGLYKIAQDAINNAAKYGPKLVETQQLEKVDAIAGATASYELFENAVGIALKEAKAE